MRYGYDLRKRVVDFVRSGFTIQEAAVKYELHRTTIGKWLRCSDLKSYEKPGPKGRRKIDVVALAEKIKENPHKQQKEWAEEFGVHPSTIMRARRSVGITRKKNLDVRGKK